MSDLNRKMLEDTVSGTFDLEQYRNFIQYIFSHVEVKQGAVSSAIGQEFKDYIKSLTEIAAYTDQNNRRITVLAVELMKGSSIEKARSIQRNVVAKFLDHHGYDAALVAFYSENQPNWRLSFVRIDDSFTKQGLFKNVTPAKRYSYLMGPGEPNHTVKAQLLPLFQNDLDPSMDELEEAFSVDKVTKSFFEEYKQKYQELQDYLESNVNFKDESMRRGFTSEQFSKKLMGQLSFLYFLQKKGWLGVKIVPKNISDAEFLTIYNHQTGDEQDLLNQVFLRNSVNERVLNADALLKLSDEAADRVAGCFKGSRFEEKWGEGEKRFLRHLFDTQLPDKNFYEDYLEPLFYNALNLKRFGSYYFKLLNCKIPFLNGGLFEPIDEYDWQKVKFGIPDAIFSNKSEMNKVGTGILDMFDRYNFTIIEDEPLDKEVAVDPEMLGKIFENLLDVSDRKSKGAFYTPREIVHFMCQESLIQYLANVTDIEIADIQFFIHYGEFIKDEDSRNEVGKEKEYLIPHNILKHISQIDEALANLKVADPSVGSGAFPLGMLNEIVKARMNITEYLCKDKSMIEAEQIRCARSSYLLKKDTIKNCLFAVDIESSAVEITKLRLWLSLIVDENENGIRALPNLDYNIMCGNSLIDEFEGIKLFDESLLTGHQRVLKNKQLELFSDRTDDIVEQLYMLQQRLFDEQNASKKKEIKNEVVRMEWELIRYTLERENKPEALKKLEKYKKDKSKPYFLWKLEFSNIFKEKSGFDIVIGNPPYGAELDDASKKVIRKNVVDTQNLNSAAVFIDYAKNQWIHAKGIVSFIVPKSLLYSEKWYSLVESLLEKTSVLVDVEKAFDKVKLEQVVFIYNHSFQIKEYLARKFLDKQFIRDTIIGTALVHKFKAWICDVSQEELDLVKSIQAETIFLKEISITKRGMGLQKFLADQGDYPVVGGKNIFRYGCEGIKGYLPQKLVDNQASKLSFMQNPKIISQDLVAHVQNPEPHILITSYYDESGTIISMDTVQNTILHDSNYSYKYIIALLNSTFVSWYTYKFIYCSAIRTMHFDNNYIGKIIIPRISLEQQQTIVQMVDQLSGMTSRSGYKSERESKEAASMIMKELDQAIYRLYGLTDAQIRLVMKSNK